MNFRNRALMLAISLVLTGCATGAKDLNAEFIDAQLVDIRKEIPPDDLRKMRLTGELPAWRPALDRLIARLADGEAAASHKFVKLRIMVEGDYGASNRYASAHLCSTSRTVHTVGAPFKDPGAPPGTWVVYILQPDDGLPYQFSRYDLKQLDDDICGSLGSGNNFNLRFAGFLVDRDVIARVFEENQE